MERGAGGAVTLRWRRDGDGVEITRVASQSECVILPAEIGGLPVTALGHHAFASGSRQAEGKTLVLGGGLEAAEENSKISRIVLPLSLLRIGDYAFYNCFALEELELWGNARSWGGGALMNCRSLNRFQIHLPDERAEVLGYFADQLSRELDATLYYPDGEMARLMFPEYLESYEENTPAKLFDYHIYGAGYRYRQCFWQKALLLGEYDEQWKSLLGMEHEPLCALRLAYYRLRYPRGLKAAAAAHYLAYLRLRETAALDWLLETEDNRGLAWFLEMAEPTAEGLAAACDKARKDAGTEAMALLLEAKNRRGGGENRNFTL